MLAEHKNMTEIRDMLVTARQNVVELIDQGLDIKAIRAADPLAELNPVWEEGLIKSRAFVNIIYQSETGEWSIPDEIKRWDE